MQRMSKKDMLILAGASIISMAAGIVVGCLKERIMKVTTQFLNIVFMSELLSDIQGIGFRLTKVVFFLNPVYVLPSLLSLFLPLSLLLFLLLISLFWRKNYHQHLFL